MDVSTSQPAYPNSDAQPNKRRRKKSMVWDHFTIETLSPDNVRASCNQCKKSFAYLSGSKLAGTSHLKRHIALGICPTVRPNKEKAQPGPYKPPRRSNIPANGSNLQRKRYRAANGVANVQFNSNNNFSHELAKMIIQHNYPLHMVEHAGFINFARSLQPQFNIASVGTVQEQITGIYKRGKQRLVEFLSGIPGQINLTLELLTSSQSLVYVLITGHFTDHDWRLQKRVFNFFIVRSPDSDTAFNSAIASCLNDWNLEGKLFTITLDRAYANKNAGESLRNLLSINNSVVLKGQLVIKSCYARLLKSLAQDAIESLKESVEKVRHSVKYIKTSEAHEERFIKLKQLLQVPTTKNLMIDDFTKWNTTYEMLTGACEVKQVFSCLDTSDPDYESTLSMEDWRQVEILGTFLKIIYEAADRLTSPIYPTANLFFSEACDIHLELMHAAMSHDSFVSTLIRPLHEKFAEFWEDNYVILAIAAVLDPRFKVELVESKFSCMYGKDGKTWTSFVRESLYQLFVEYEVRYVEGNETLLKTEVVVPHEDILLAEGDDLLNFDLDISDFMGEPHIRSELDDGYLEDPVFHQPHMKSELDQHLEEHVFRQHRTNFELDQYLGEPVFPYVHEFDVLGWWKVYGSKYPILSKVACDVLSVPFSTIPPEYVFDTRERMLDSYQGSLCQSTLQASMCAKDWLKYASAETEFGISSEIEVLGDTVVKTEF